MRKRTFLILGLVAATGGLLLLPACDSNPAGSTDSVEQGSTTYRGAVPGDSIVDITIEAGRIESWGGVGHFSVIIQDIPWRLEGFDLLLSYDDSIYSIWDVERGALFDCGWEYFTYRSGEQAGAGCPPRAATGLLRVVGIAETNNGPYHPDFSCVDDLPFAFGLFTVALQPTVDEPPVWAPVRFYWCDCGDNSLAFWPGDPYGTQQGVSRYVIDHDSSGYRRHVENDASGFPTLNGVQYACLGGGQSGSQPQRVVDFVSASIMTGFAAGDINLNTHRYELADAVLLSNWFVYGDSAFVKHCPTQLAVSDVNQDGIPHTVADMEYLIRIIVGDALPYAKLTPDTTTVSIYSDGSMSVTDSMGSVKLSVIGEVIPELLADNMDIKWHYDGRDTHVLVYSMEPGEKLTGTFLRLRGGIMKSIELATYEGSPVHFNVEHIGTTD